MLTYSHIAIEECVTCHLTCYP